MIRSDLVNKIADIHTELYHRDAEIVVAAVLEEIVDALSRGDRVEIRGFGVFAVKQRKARVGRNPLPSRQTMAAHALTRQRAVVHPDGAYQ